MSCLLIVEHIKGAVLNLAYEVDFGERWITSIVIELPSGASKINQCIDRTILLRQAMRHI